MIPEGRTAIDAEEAALLHGMTIETARRRKLFDEPGFPARLTRGRNKPLYDRDQVRAHALGEPIPVLPKGERPGDLLDREEAAEVWGVTLLTWNKYMSDERTPLVDKVIGGRDLWFRRTLQEFKRPGRGAGAGRPVGAKDTTSRGPYRSKSERLEVVAEVTKELGPDADSAEIVTRIVERAGVSRPSAARMLREAREEPAE